MKLKNKKTGEIVKNYLIESADAIGTGIILQDDNTNKHYEYHSLAEFNEEWEDYEEPKGIQCIYYVNHFDAAKLDGVIVGFGAEEEAEKAVEKLKAWKRLKDRGFRFTGYTSKDRGTITEFEIYCDTGKPCIDRDEFTDLDLLFGGEK